MSETKPSVDGCVPGGSLHMSHYLRPQCLDSDCTQCLAFLRCLGPRLRRSCRTNLWRKATSGLLACSFTRSGTRLRDKTPMRAPTGASEGLKLRPRGLVKYCSSFAIFTCALPHKINLLHP